MKIGKKVGALLLSVALFLMLAVNTLAAGDGKITVNGTIAGKTYDIYKIFDLTHSTSSGNTNVAYTVDADWVNFFFDGLGTPKTPYLVSVPSPGLNALTYNGNTYYINLSDGNVAAFAQAALGYTAAKVPDQSAQALGSTLEFDNLDLGYYLVYPQGATDINTSAGYASLSSLTSTTPNGTVNIKATYPTIDKTVDDQPVEVGQKVTYTVTGQVPDTTGYTTYHYVVKDTMSVGLTFNAGVSDFSVKFGSTPISVAPVYSANGFTLTFDMVQYQAHKGDNIQITYSAVVNENAVATLTKNGVTLTYSNDPSDDSKTETTPPVEKEVYTSKIVVDKHDGKNPGRKLSDAKFVLVKKSNSVPPVETFYKYDAVNQAVSWASTISDATVMTTDSQGEATFLGLEDGTYYLRETAAPAGYNLLPNDVQAVIASIQNPSGQYVGVSLTAEVANLTGTPLPQTGGIGTRIFYIVGASIVFGVILLLIARKRMSRES